MPQSTLPEVTGNGFHLIPMNLIGEDEGGGNYIPTVWKFLSPSESAILVALGSHVIKSIWTFPSEERLGALSGLTPKTVRKALKGLTRFGLIEIHDRTTSAGQPGKRYKWLIPRSGKNLLRIPHALINGGVWSKLPPASKKLYFAFRFFGRPDPKLAPEFDASEHPYGDWLGSDPDLRREFLMERKADYCKAARLKLCEFAGISDRRFKGALMGLEDACLVSMVSPGRYEILIEPG